jgi:hypothetical protein
VPLLLLLLLGVTLRMLLLQVLLHKGLAHLQEGQPAPQ